MLLKSIVVVATLATAAILTLAMPGQGTAQAHKTGQYPYTLVDLGTLGGPQADIGNVPASALTGNGVVVAVADTAVADPYTPNDNPAFSGDPYVQHTFIWRNGVKTDLGALGPVSANNSSFPNSVNAQGDVVGLSDNGTVDPIQGTEAAVAVLWRDGKIIDLGTLGGGNESLALSLNKRDQVVGVAANTIADPFSMFGFATQTRAFFWQHGIMHDLGTLGGPDAAPFFVNDRGQVAGASYTNSTPNPVTGSPTLDPFMWEDGTMRDLGTLGGTQGFPNSMNSRGEVVGQSNLSGDQIAHPFLWNGQSLIDLGTLGGNYGGASGLNDAGEVVGTATIPSGEGRAFLWKNGVMTNLGVTKGDRCTGAIAINDHNQIVGGESASCGESEDAFLWEKGSMKNLNSLIAPSSLHLKQAFNINDKGEIVGYGALPNGDQREFLLLPNDH